MNIVIVYESVYGNTRLVAEAIATGARQSHPDGTLTVTRCDAASLSLVAGADLLIVGGPTHMLGMTRQSSRSQAVAPPKKNPDAPRHLEPGAEGPGIREWLATLPRAARTRAAAFDTRLSHPLAGGAAPRIARKLRRLGYTIAAKPEGFIVAATEGPMREGELDRARHWGADLAAHRIPRHTAKLPAGARARNQVP